MTLIEYARRIRYWLESRSEQSGIEDEMRLHVELRAERLRNAGMSDGDASSAARRRFGNQLQIRETSREMWINRWFDDFVRDVQIGARGLARNPGFTFVAVLTIAIALGANTAIFSVIHTVLLKPLPYPNAEQIVQLARTSRHGGRFDDMSGAQLLYIRDHATALRSVAAIDLISAGFSLTSAGEPVRISGSRISAGMFETLGMPPVAGRAFTTEEDQPGAADVAVISDSLWQSRFGRAESALGTQINLNGRPHTIVGVMPPAFLARGATTREDVWVPLRMAFDPGDKATAYILLARIKDGVTRADTNAQLDQVAEGMRKEFPQTMNPGQSFAGIPYREFLVGDVRPALLVLAGAVGLVLLLACANVANLLLARAVGRQKEIAVRTAMGASGGRLLRQLLTESLLLAGTASLIGLLLASAGMHALLRSLPESIPWSGDIRFDAPVVAFTSGLAILTGLLFGLAPALPRAFTGPGGGLKISETLKTASGRNTSAGATGKLRTALVGVEVAVSVVLLVGGALLMQSFLRLRSVTTGFDPAHVLTAKMSLQKHTDTQSMMNFLDPLLARINASPGVVSAGTVTSLPLEQGPEWEFEVEGRADFSIDSHISATSPLYFETMGIRLTGGRRFNDHDNAAAPPVLIVNEAFVRQTFEHGNAIGQRVRLVKQAAAMFDETAPREIVGVVADVHERALRGAPRPAAYIPQAQLSNAFGRMITHFLPISIAIKTEGAPLAISQSVKQIVLSVDPLQPVADIRLMDEIVSQSTSRDRFNLTLMGVFALVALVLASIGIYGVVSYAVSQRTQEIGVRIALGASFLDVMRLVVGGGMLVSMIGVAVGLAGAFGLSRFLSQLLFSIKAGDPMTFSFVALLMLTVAFLANLVPRYGPHALIRSRHCAMNEMLGTIETQGSISMRRFLRDVFFAGLCLAAANGRAFAQANSWSPKAAAGYLDERIDWWMKWPASARDHQTFCVSCHTAAPYALGRPALRHALAEQSASPNEQKLLENITKRVRMWKDVEPFYPDQTTGLPKSSESRGTEAILNALILVSNDARAGTLSADGRLALDNMWALQFKRGDMSGSWAWLQFHNSPWEGDSQFYGTALAAVAIGTAPGGYQSEPGIQAGIKLMRAYLEKNMATQTPADRVVLLWASAKIPSLLTDEQKKTIVDQTLALQKDDGGFSMSALAGGWKRRDNTPLDSNSDGYATGLVAYTFEQLKTAQSEPALKRALLWLGRNQVKEDGRWAATSLNKQRELSSDAGRFMSDAATAYAVLALENAK